MTLLPDGALEAIAVEHERDHSDLVRPEPREGCNGCKMLSHAFALRAQLRACEAALKKIQDDADQAHQRANRAFDVKDFAVETYHRGVASELKRAADRLRAALSARREPAP